MPIPRHKRKQASLSVRVTASERTKFHSKATPHGGGSAVLRELVLAFIDGRVTIQPPATREGSLYDARSQD